MAKLKVRRIRIEIEPTLIHLLTDEDLERMNELEDQMEALDAEEEQDQEAEEVEESEEAESEEAEESDEAEPTGPIVVVLREANRAGNIRRIQALSEAAAWKRKRQIQMLIDKGEIDSEDEDVPGVLIDSVELPSKDEQDDYDAMIGASVIIGSLDLKRCERTELWMPESIEGWAELQDWLYAPMFDSALMLNSHWYTGLTPKNRMMPG